MKSYQPASIVFLVPVLLILLAFSFITAILVRVWRAVENKPTVVQSLTSIQNTYEATRDGLFRAIRKHIPFSVELYTILTSLKN